MVTRRGLRGLAALFMLASLWGCASGPSRHPADPFEPLNRQVYQFNEAVDGVIFKPVATAYKAVTPDLLRTGVNNFFSNIGDGWSLVNALLQLKPKEAAEGFLRVGLNTFLGLGGILDVASEIGIERHKEDFGQTLGRWGVPPGPYLVLPILGPSTLRDAVALKVDAIGNLVYQIDHIPTRNELLFMNAVDTRATLLRAGEVMEEAALDKYSFRRDAHLQKRRNDIYDGMPPEVPEPEEAPTSEAATPATQPEPAAR